jgi:hypothetical protein
MAARRMPALCATLMIAICGATNLVIAGSAVVLVARYDKERDRIAVGILADGSFKPAGTAPAQ